MKDLELEAYCEALEEEFFRLKGRAGTLSPEDFARARTWYGAGISLSVAIEGVRLAFEERSTGRDGGLEEVNGLGYCQSFVEQVVARLCGR